MVTHIVKRAGHKETYDQRKVYGSVYAACLACRIEKATAEDISSVLTKEITHWIRPKKEVTSLQIFRRIIRELRRRSRDAAFMYETHRDVS